MLNQTILLKVRQRLNKLDSQDYDNIEDWKIIEAFNKGQVDWCRRNLHGLNIVKEGDEQSTRRIDDLQVLLETEDLNLTDRQIFFQGQLPTDYLQWKRVSCKAKNKCCEKPKPKVVYLAEVANVDELLRDKNKKPDFEWGETFTTMQGDDIRIYTNGEFQIIDAELTYYRQPVKIEIAGIQDPYTLTTPAVDVISEFKDDLVELFIDECAKIIAGDIESMNQLQRQTQATEGNN